MAEKNTNLTENTIPEVSVLMEMLKHVPKVSPATKQTKEKELECVKPTIDIMKEIRLTCGASQPDVAWEMGMVQQNLSRFETNTINPRLSTVKRYLEACGVDLDALLASALAKMEDDIKLNINSHRYNQKELHSLYIWKNNKSMDCSKKEFENAMWAVLDIRVKIEKVIEEDDDTCSLLFYIHNEDVPKLENSIFNNVIVKYDDFSQTELVPNY